MAEADKQVWLISGADRELGLDIAKAVLVTGRAVVVSSLNRSVKEVTGWPTTAHIAEHLTNEAKLLHHTDWSVGDIADRLGFAYGTYFHRFFKQHTGTMPLAFRQAS
jgi:AraC family transcriptional activator of pobA